MSVTCSPNSLLFLTIIRKSAFSYPSMDPWVSNIPQAIVNIYKGNGGLRPLTLDSLNLALRNLQRRKLRTALLIIVMTIVCANFIQQVNFSIGLAVTGDVEEAQAEWEQRATHLTFFDADIYPQGKQDPKVTIPRDVARITNDLYNKAFEAADEVKGKVAREVVLSYGKIQITKPGEFEMSTIPAGEQYMELIGMDSPYITIFLNSTPTLQLVDCPYCDGAGCDKCDQTGKWGRYPPPAGGGIVISQYYMLREDLNLTLYYDSAEEKWVGSNVTVFYDLEGAKKTGEYTLYVGIGHAPPTQGIPLQIIGVIRSEPNYGLISLKDAWTLKGMDKERWSSFMYIRIPKVTDFGTVNSRLSRYYPQYNVFVLYPLLKTVTATINILQWELPLVAGLVALLIFLNMMQMSIYERIREVGTMRALGAETTTSVLIFSFEGLVIGGIGGLVGYAVAVVISLVTKYGGINPELVILSAIGPGKLILGLGFGLVIAFVGASLPAFFAIARSPDECLRGGR